MSQLDYLYGLALDHLRQCEHRVVNLDKLNAQSYLLKLQFLDQNIKQAYQNRDANKLLECSKILISIHEGLNHLSLSDESLKR